MFPHIFHKLRYCLKGRVYIVVKIQVVDTIFFTLDIEIEIKFATNLQIIHESELNDNSENNKIGTTQCCISLSNIVILY